MHTHAKMICTIGPSTWEEGQMKALIEAGMNCARINFSHSKREDHGKTIEKLKKVRSETGKPLVILLDTKGPEVRVGILKNESLELPEGQVFELVGQDDYHNDNQIPVTMPQIFSELKEGNTVLFDDGYVASKVIASSDTSVTIKILNSGQIVSSKGVNVPEVHLPIAFLSEKDKLDIEYGCKVGIDAIAASFVCTAEDVLELRRFLLEIGYPEVQIISKIESSVGVSNIDSIINVTDGIMVARGDLGVEVAASTVPRLQKMMIEKCLLAAKPVVVATQMLESMIRSPRPTRAEVSDVATAVYQGASAVMLSGESAMGKYPIEAARMMKKVVAETEKDFDNKGYFYSQRQKKQGDIAAATATAVVESAYSCMAKAIFTFVTSGHTIKLISRLLPSMRIIALTTDEKIFHQLGLVWGVEPFLTDQCSSFDDFVDQLTEKAMKEKLVHKGDVVVVTGGFPFGTPKSTNMLLIDHIGDVIVRGSVGIGDKVEGQVQFVYLPENKKEYEGKILVLPKLNKDFLPLLDHAQGVILDHEYSDVESHNLLLKEASKRNVPAILGATGAFELIQEGSQVSLDPKKALVFQA